MKTRTGIHILCQKFEVKVKKTRSKKFLYHSSIFIGGNVRKSTPIVELKFGHDMGSWDEVTKHIINKLKMKMSGKAWLSSSGPHFRVIAFRMDKVEYERWKLSTYNWERIARTVSMSKLFR